MTTLKITLLTSVIIMAFVVSCKTQSVSDISTNQWKEDIDYLVSKMASTIPNYQKRVDSSLLEVRLAILKQSIESKSSNQIVVALEELLNTVKDESYFIYPFQEQLNYKILPIRT